MPATATRLAPRSLKERVEALLSEYLEDRAAKTAVKVASRTWLRVEPEALLDSHLLVLTFGLRPILERAVGAALAGVVISRVLQLAR